MAEVKWIKIVTDIFDDEKILLIEQLPEGYAIIVCWFKLLCLAGKQNNSGVFIMSNKIPYTDEMLSVIFRMKKPIVQMALEVFKQYGMIEIVDDIITIPRWGKHQNLEQLENRKDYMREYMQEYRAKQKGLIEQKSDVNNVNSLRKPNVNPLDIDIDKDIDKDIDNIISKYNVLLVNDETYYITDEMINQFKLSYKNISVEDELIKIQTWCLSNPAKRKTKRGALRFINNWLNKANDDKGVKNEKNKYECNINFPDEK